MSASVVGDGLENWVAQLGTQQDKRSHSVVSNSKRLSHRGNKAEIDALYRTDWAAGKIVDILPDDMCREWRSFVGDIEPEVVRRLEAEEDRLQLRSKFNFGHKMARLYGTACIVLAVNDGLEPDQPLEIESLGPGCLKHINVVDRHRFDMADIFPISDPMSASFGLPEHYRFAETSVKIHHTRMIRFDGLMLPFDSLRENNYMSDGVLDRIYESIINFATATQASASMIHEANVDVIKIANLMDRLATAEGEKLLQKRWTLAGMFKSINNALLMDGSEEYEKKSNSFGGLPELIDRYANILVAASDIPATRLLGSSASGLMATGEGDLKNYYDKCRALQNVDYRPKLDYFDKIMAKSLGIDYEEMTYDFNTLHQPTPSESAAIKLQNAQADQVYLQFDVLPTSTIAQELQQTGAYTNITDEYIAELQAEEEGGIDEIDGDTIQPETSAQAAVAGEQAAPGGTGESSEGAGGKVPGGDDGNTSGNEK